MSDMLSQEEIDALLRGSTGSLDFMESDKNFSEDEKDAIGEIGNISMGTAATTLSTLLGQKVTITTPKVSVITVEELSYQYPLPLVAVDVKYKEGLEGTNVLILRENDVKIITDLMMGGSGEIREEDLSELHLSAIGEAMNQMIGSASTSLSEMFHRKIDICPPEAFQLDLSSGNFKDHFPNLQDVFVRIAFNMVVGNLIDSEMMQLIPINFAKEIVNTLLYGGGQVHIESANNSPQPNRTDSKLGLMEREVATDHPSASYASANHDNKSHKPEPQKIVNVQPIQFQSFDQPSIAGVPENIALIQDVPLKITVELGRTVKKISEILEFAPGTIIELDKLVGEALDILVNGQYVAKGEVVVIDENYGIRVTDIINPAKRFSKI